MSAPPCPDPVFKATPSSRPFWAALVLLVLVALAVSPQRALSPAGFFAGSLLTVVLLGLLGRPPAGASVPLGWQLLAYALLGLASTVYAPYWFRSWMKFGWMGAGLFMFFLAWATVRRSERLGKLQWALAAVATLMALYSLGHEWASPASELAEAVLAQGGISAEVREDLLYALSTLRIRGPFGNPNHLAGFLVACSSPWLLQLLRGKDWKVRGLSLAGFLPVAWVIWKSQSRSGMLTLLLTVLILALGVFSEFRKNIFHWRLSPVKVIALLLILVVLSFAFAESWVALSRIGTIKTRMEYYTIALKLIARSPLIGHGLDSYALFYPQYHRLGRGEAQYVHNWPLEVWTETGLLGLMVFGWLIVSIYRVFNHELNAAQDRREEVVLLVLMSSVSAILLQSLFDFNTDVAAIFIYFGFFLGCLSGLASARVQQHDTRRSFWSGRLPRGGLAVLLVAFWLTAWALPYWAERAYESGLALVRAGESSWEATAYLEKAVRLNPQSAEYINTLGNHRLAIEQPRRALEALETATRLNPLKPRNHFDLFRAYRAVGEKDKALQALRTAHQLHPADDEYLTALAQWHAAQGDRDSAERFWSEAAETLEGAIEANPGKAVYHRRLARILEALGRPEEARRHRARADEIFESILLDLGVKRPSA